MIKKALLVFASAFLIWQSVKMLFNIQQLQPESWLVIVFLAWVLNMFITGVFAFAGFALPTERMIPASYYQIRRPDRLKRVYTYFGVAVFRKFLLATLWKKKSQRKKYFNGRADGIQNLVEQSKKSEFGHLIPFFILTLLSVYFITGGQVEFGLTVFVINFIGNGYPVVLQRHHRMRVARLLKK